MRELEERIAGLEDRLSELTAQFADPTIQSDPSKTKQLGKEHRRVTELVDLCKAVFRIEGEMDDAKEMLRSEQDPEIRQMAEEELTSLEATKQSHEERIEFLLIPPDPLDGKNILLEIRAGAGGDEAAIFVGDLLRMYLRYAESRSWQTQMISTSGSDMGGFKEVVAEIKGDDVYSHLKYESGVHRVQRVPTTERQGRIHTSTVTVAVLPEAEDVDVELNEKDLRVDVYRSSGAGGQHVNKTDSAVRMTHIPTGIVVACQDERSQLQNRARALQIMRARLLDQAIQDQANARAADRKSQVGTGDRSERIRTYNYPQNRVTDHRVNFTTKSLTMVMEGEFEPLVDALREATRKERLKETDQIV